MGQEQGGVDESGDKSTIVRGYDSNEGDKKWDSSSVREKSKKNGTVDWSGIMS